MKTAEDVKAFIEYRDSYHKELRGGVVMIFVEYHYKWITESELLQDWIDHVYQPTHPTLPSDEEIRSVRNTFVTPQEKLAFNSGLNIASARIAEMEEFRKLARLISALNEDHDNFKCIAGHIQLARKLLTPPTHERNM